MLFLTHSQINLYLNIFKSRLKSIMKIPCEQGTEEYYINVMNCFGRFLLQASQEDKMITNADVCCWKV